MQVFFDHSNVSTAHNTSRKCIVCGEGFPNGSATVELIAHEREDRTWVTRGAAHPDCITSAKARCEHCKDKCYMKHGLCKLESF